jgi:hypothetical protein
MTRGMARGGRDETMSTTLHHPPSWDAPRTPSHTRWDDDDRARRDMGGTTEDGGEMGERGDRCDETRGVMKGAYEGGRRQGHKTVRGWGGDRDKTTRGGAHAEAKPAPPTAAASNCSQGRYRVRVEARRQHPDAGDDSPAPTTHHCKHSLAGWTGC